MSVTVEALTVRFGSRIVLHEAHAHFRDGDLTAVIGPSGSGKSTLLSVISGEDIASGGSVIADGRIDWLVQSTPLFQRRIAIENVIASATYNHAARSLAILHGLRSMRAIGIMHLARTMTYRLSGGEKQRVAVARAMTSKADVIIADEPTASLDAASREKVCDALAAAARAGSAVIIATHDPYVASRCDVVYALTNGALTESRP